VNLQVQDISSPGYPVDVPPMIYILFVFAVANRRSPPPVPVMLCCSSYRRKEHHTLHKFLQATTKDVTWGGGGTCSRSHTCKPFARKHYVETGTRPLYGQEAPRPLVEEFCYSHNDSVAMASCNSAAATMILWLWHHAIQQQPQ